jgi:hypothetical protein
MSAKNDDPIQSGHTSDIVAASTAATADKTISDVGLEGPHTKLVFNTQDFLSFLAQADISKVLVETTDGHRISASFSGRPMRPSSAENASIFNSLDLLKSLDSTGREDSIETNVAKTTVSLEFLKDGTVPDPTAFNKATGAATSMGYNPFESREWAAEYANSHVEVSYSSCFGDRFAPPGAGEYGTSHLQRNHRPPGIGALSELGQVAAAVASASAGTSLPPKKRAARDVDGAGGPKTDWFAMYNSALKPLVEAASLAQKEQPTQTGPTSGTRNNNMIPPVDSSKSTPGSSSSSVGGCPNNKKKRKPRKIVPEVKLYVKFTDKDVLFGRGGRSNHHIGNKIYREIVTEQQERYRACDKNEKTKVAQTIVDRVHNEIGGRFLELDTTVGKWFLVPNVVARRKVGQALRENNTEEARAAKRAKYQGGKANKKEKATAAIGTEIVGNRPSVTAHFV